MHEHDIEGELDAALARYAAVEPRDGLEQRVFASLQVQHTRASRIGWQHWIALGFAAASLAALAIWAGGRHSALLNVDSRTAQRETASTRTRFSVSAVNVGHAPERSPREPATINARREYRERGAVPANVAAVPKLAQFPAPEPLNEEEKLLIQFVRQDPQDAALVAEATMERLQRESDGLKAASASAE